MANYYNENDPYTAKWLRNLIKAGEIPDGVVDDRSITEVRATDLLGFTQHHFFAGIAGWSRALALAGWPDDRPVITGSVPCQPFSQAGRHQGTKDQRHLWPEFYRIIRESQPSIVFGEQVASKDARRWFDGDQDLQRMFDAEAIVRVLQEQGIIKELPDYLQEMLHRERPDKKNQYSERRNSGEVQGMEKNQSCKSINHIGQISRKAERSRVFYRSQEYPRCDRCGRLRINRDSIQSRRRKNLGQSINRQNRLDEGLYAEECPCGAVLRERDGEHLGREQDYQNFERHYEHQEESLSGISGALGCRFKASDQYPDLSGIRVDLESCGFAVWATDLPAACVGAPHIRQRLFWVASRLAQPNGRHPSDGDLQRGWQHRQQSKNGQPGSRLGNATSDHERRDPLSRAYGQGESIGGPSRTGRLEYAESHGRGEWWTESGRWSPPPRRGIGWLDQPNSSGRQPGEPTGTTVGYGDTPVAAGPGMEHTSGEHDQHDSRRFSQTERTQAGRDGDRSGCTNPANFWDDYNLIPCSDGKTRRLESGCQPLVTRLSEDMGSDGPGQVSHFRTITDQTTGRVIGQAQWRIGMLRGYGNSIVPQVAAVFIRAFLDCENTP